MCETDPLETEQVEIEEYALEELPADHRSGVVAVIGRPNVGKSTLLNRLLGQKIAITSPKPQTTRDQLLGILTLEDAQILFMDTPGIHQPKHKLGEYMMKVAEETIEDADVVLWLVDVNVAPKDEDLRIAELLFSLHQRGKLSPRLVLGLNKVDHYHGGANQQEARISAYLELLGWLSGGSESAESGESGGDGVYPMLISALRGDGTDELLTLLQGLLPLGPRYYPADQVTDIQTRFIVAELIREKALMLLQQEVPHSLAVVVDEYTQRSEDMTYISAILYVERKSQKGIVLGQRGAMIKNIGQAARSEIEELVGTRVYLELWVKVYEKWRRREGLLRRLGYATN
jgi:GTP-binding protein Era